MIRVLLADDEPLVRASIHGMADWASDDISMVADASNGEEALRILGEGSIDVVLLDMHMPRCDGIEFLRRLSSVPSPPAVVVLSAFDDFALVREAFTLGAFDYLLKADLTAGRIRDILRRASTETIAHRGGRRIDGPPQDERLHQQILRDLLRSETPETFVPILEELQIELPVPFVPCEYRIESPAEGLEDPETPNRRRDTAIQFLRNGLESRSSGRSVALTSQSLIWLQFFGTGDSGPIVEQADSLCRDVALLIRQTLNINVDWAVGEPVESLSGIPSSMHALSRLFSAHSRPIHRARAYIQKHYSDPELSLADTAEYAGISRTHLSTLFARECGEGFAEFLTRVRIESACELLRSTRMKVYEISEKVGYRSVEHFSRTFKKATGSTPNKLQNEAHGANLS